MVYKAYCLLAIDENELHFNNINQSINNIYQRIGLEEENAYEMAHDLEIPSFKVLPYFYQLLNNETNPYIYLIGGGNIIESNTIYNFSNPVEKSKFVSQFKEEEQIYVETLEDTLKLLETTDSKKRGISLSVCFINEDTSWVEKAYCLLAIKPNYYKLDDIPSLLNSIDIPSKISLNPDYMLPDDLELDVPAFEVNWDYSNI